MNLPPWLNDRLRKGKAPSIAVPAIVWVWLGLLVFWTGVTAANRIAPEKAPAATPGAAGKSAEPLTAWLTDPGGLFARGERERIETRLAAFERETSIQLAVAVYPTLPSAPVEEFTLRTAERSRIGRRGVDNGAILFVFVAERLARLEIGYGLEGAIPDVTALHLLDEALVPFFARGEYALGLEATLSAILSSASTEAREMKAPGPVSAAWRQTVSAARRIGREAWPFLRGTSGPERFVISLIGGLLGVGAWDGLSNFLGILRAFAVYFAGVLRGRPSKDAFEKVRLRSIKDTVILLVLFVSALGGIVLVAGDGRFGGAGALVPW